MAKKQKSFADKAAGSKNKEAVYVKYVKSVKSDKTGQWRFNEQIVQTSKGGNLDVALKRLDELANLTDIDLSDSIVKESSVEETPVVENENVAPDEVDAAPETTDEPTAAVVEEEKV